MKGDRIAGLRSPAGCLISMYVDRPSPGGFGALLLDLLKPIRDQAESLDRSAMMSVRSDTRRIHGLAEELEADSAPSYAFFASELDGFFVFEPLAHPASNISKLGPRPYLRPLRAAPRSMRSGVLVADRTQARTFAVFEGLVDELGQPIIADVGKSNYGGFAGYEEQGVRAHADEVSSKIWKEAGQRLLDAHQRRPFDYLAIGGHEETVEEIARTLHPYLGRLQRASFTGSPQTITPTVLRSEMATLDVELRYARQEALAGHVCDTTWSGGNAVLGLSATLEAVNTQAVEILVVAGPFSRPGALCDDCGHLTRNGVTCPLCDSKMFAVDDVVAAAMEATISAGGKAYQIEVASSVDPHGVGALTRFPVPASTGH